MKNSALLTDRYDPLEKVFFFDDFDHGLNGWTGLIGNYEDSLESVLPEFRDLRPPQLSNLTMWDTGTAGSAFGTYALKLATRPRLGSLAVGIKRQTFRHAARLRLEAYLTFKPEASQLRLSALDVRAFGVAFDLQDGYGQADGLRWMPHLRYLNAQAGERQGRWQFKAQTRPLTDIGGTGETQSHFHLGPEGWQDVPNAQQLTCYNEITTKMNWSYLRVGLDLHTRTITDFQFDDHVFSGEGLGVITLPAMRNLWCMLNTLFFVETDTDQRAFLYVDSVLLSGEGA
ncbi:MAG: hypothetical protein HC915_01680 [Anaerolineae bacterium]|nr:hypothetical protein [Anaerolineae bacterium]